MDKKLLIALGAAALVMTTASAASPSPARVKAFEKTNLKQRACKTLSTPSELTVLRQVEVAPGIVKRAVRDSRGRVYCDMVRNGVPSKAPEFRAPKHRAPSEDASFYDGFEAWNGVTPDWTPEGWTEINLPHNIPTEWMAARNVNMSWYNDWTGDGYWTDITTDGEKEMFIHFTYKGEYQDENGETVEFEANPQDEWLVSPAFTVKANQKLFFELEMDPSNVYPLDYETMKFDRSVIDHDVEVLISTDGGENWTAIWKGSEKLAAPLSDSELYAHMAELKYRTIAINIDEYTGKEIKLAFRYYNRGGGAMCGNSVALDAVTVDAPQALAGYALPAGALLSEFGTDLSVWDSSLALLPAYAKSQWINKSNQYCESYEWSFYNPATGETETLTDENPEKEYAYSAGEVYPYPTLKSSNSYSSAEYKFDSQDEKEGGVLYGGSVPAMEDGTPVAVGNVDYIHNSIVLSYIELGGDGRKTSYLYGTHEPGAWGENVESVGVGNFFAKPATPFFVSGMMLTLGTLDADPDAEFTVTVYPIDSWGYEGEPIATATAKASDAVRYDDFINLPFYFKSKDSELPQAPAGFDYNDTFVAIVSGYADNPKVREFGACSQYFDNADGSNYAYVRLRQPWEDNFYEASYPASEIIEDYHNTLYLSLFGEYNFLVPDTEDVVISEELDTPEITFTSLHSPDQWWIDDYETQSALYLDQPRSSDWLTLTPSTSNGVHKLLFSASPTENDRMMYLPLNAKGVSLYIRISQKASTGISIVKGETLKVVALGDEVKVTGAEAGAETAVYTLDGRMAGKTVAGADGNATLRVNSTDQMLIVKVGAVSLKLMR